MSRDRLLKIYDLVVWSGVCPQTHICEWSDIIAFCERKGYLYTFYEKDELVSVVCAYRIPKWNEKYANTYPDRESGNILYIAWAVSTSKSKTSLLHMLRGYKMKNRISEIIFYKRNSDTNLRRIKTDVKAKIS